MTLTSSSDSVVRPLGRSVGHPVRHSSGLAVGIGLGLAPCLGLLLAFATRVHADPATSSQSRSVPAFHAIELAGTIEVEVSIGKPISVEVTGDADLLDKVLTTVKDGTLVIDTTRELDHLNRRHRHLRAVVTAPDLSALSLSGTGSLKLAGIANDRLAIDLSGTGEVVATGETGALRVAVGGTGEVSAKGLSAKDVTVDLGGTGSAALRATRSVEARLTGTGSIRVAGHPTQVRKSVSGLGSIQVE